MYPTQSRTKFTVFRWSAITALLAIGVAALMANDTQRSGTPTELIDLLGKANKLVIDLSGDLERQSAAKNFGWADYSICDKATIKSFTKELKRRLKKVKRLDRRILSATYVDVRALTHPDDKEPLATVALYGGSIMYTIDGETWHYSSVSNNDLFSHILGKDLKFAEGEEE